MPDSKKLVWDREGEHFYETGTDHGVLYPYSDTVVTGTQSHYGPGVAWNGLTGFTASPEGAEANNIYADNIKYLVLRSAEDFKATITAYTYPEEFEECNGAKAATDGVYFGQQKRKSFGFCCRTIVGNDTQLDAHGYKLHLVYGASASPSEKAYATVNDSPEAIEFSWEVDTIPVSEGLPTGFQPTAYITIDTTKLSQQGKTNLTTLEGKLFGTDNTDPYLPMPAEVISIMTAT